MTIGEVRKLGDALETARALTEPGEINNEYVRGQAELICDLFGLDMGYKEDMIRVIGHLMPTADFELGELT